MHLLLQMVITWRSTTIEHRSDGDEIMVGIKQAKGFLDYRGSGWFLILGESLSNSVW